MNGKEAEEPKAEENTSHVDAALLYVLHSTPYKVTNY